MIHAEIASALALSDVHKSYARPSGAVHVLSGVDLDVGAGEVLGVRGESGSGKSTLLLVAGLLAKPDSGAIRLGGIDVADAAEPRQAALRATRIGFVFQAFNLLSHLTAVENVALPVPGPRREATDRAVAALEAVGLGSRAQHRPNELSGGEQQRVALARALINTPLVLLADEPTGNLDEDNERQVLGLVRAASQRGCAVVLASHSPVVLGFADRVVTLSGGRLRDRSL